MFNKILRALRYAHELPMTMVNSDGEIGDKVIPSVHTAIVNSFPIISAGDAYPWSFNWHAPIGDSLPFTPYHYFESGYAHTILGTAVKLPLAIIDPVNKFPPKGIVRIPLKDLGDLELLNYLQNHIFSLNKHSCLNAWLTLKHDDIVMNSLTSARLTKVAKTLSIPLEVITSINRIKLTCDTTINGAVENYFELIYERKTDGTWFMANIESVRAGVYTDPFTIFMHSWISIIRDIDHIVNRRVRSGLEGMALRNQIYNNRNKYSIDKALLAIAEIIDVAGNGKYSVRTVLNDNNLTPSTYLADFDAACIVHRKILEGKYK